MEKTKGAAFTLWALLGALGGHRFYLKRPWWTAVLQAALIVPFILALPHLFQAMSNALTAGMDMGLDPGSASVSATASSLESSFDLGWAGWALGANQIWWLIDGVLIPRWIRELNGPSAQSTPKR